MQKIRKQMLIILIIALNGFAAFAQDSYYTRLTKLSGYYLLNGFYITAHEKNAIEVMQDNEFDKNQAGQYVYFHTNPLVLNGKQLDYGDFDLNSRGFLTVVKGKPETPEAEPISFYVYLRRDGKIIEDKKMLFANKSLKKINLSEIFPFAKQGDLLIIQPVGAEDWRAKRILKLIGGGC